MPILSEYDLGDIRRQGEDDAGSGRGATACAQGFVRTLSTDTGDSVAAVERSYHTALSNADDELLDALRDWGDIPRSLRRPRAAHVPEWLYWVVAVIVGVSELAMLWTVLETLDETMLFKIPMVVVLGLLIPVAAHFAAHAVKERRSGVSFSETTSWIWGGSFVAVFVISVGILTVLRLVRFERLARLTGLSDQVLAAVFIGLSLILFVIQFALALGTDTASNKRLRQMWKRREAAEDRIIALVQRRHDTLETAQAAVAALPGRQTEIVAAYIRGWRRVDENPPDLSMPNVKVPASLDASAEVDDTPDFAAGSGGDVLWAQWLKYLADEAAQGAGTDLPAAPLVPSMGPEAPRSVSGLPTEKDSNPAPSETEPVVAADFE